jgi:DNA-binding transcriptional ArsR family regulator
MVQDIDIEVTPRQIEIIAILAALGGRSNYQNLYRAVKDSIMAKSLKLNAKATFNHELNTLVKARFVEKEKVGKRPIYKLSRKVSEITISRDWLEKHIQTLKLLLEKIRFRSIHGYVEPRVGRLFMIEKTILDSMINGFFSAVINGESIEERLNEFTEYLRERLQQVRMLSLHDKEKLSRLIIADNLRNFYLLEALIKEAYQSLK